MLLARVVVLGVAFALTAVVTGLAVVGRVARPRGLVVALLSVSLIAIAWVALNASILLG